MVTLRSATIMNAELTLQTVRELAEHKRRRDPDAAWYRARHAQETQEPAREAGWERPIEQLVDGAAVATLQAEREAMPALVWGNVECAPGRERHSWEHRGTHKVCLYCKQAKAA